MRAETQPLITQADHRRRALAALSRGEPIILDAVDGASVVTAAETLSAARLDALRERLGGDFVVAVTARRAATLRARAYDGDLARITPRAGADLGLIRAIADPTLALSAPLSGPHHTQRGGDPAAARLSIDLCRRAQLLPAALVWRVSEETAANAAADGVTRFGAVGLVETADEPDAQWREMVNARVPIGAHPDTTLRLFRRLGSDDAHYVIQIGDVRASAPVLTRLHSACVTGDIFGSLKCDCGPQLQAALDQMGAAGGGVLVYLLQEGRGIGLANKLRAYRLQDDGFDTVDANHRLGFADDERRLSDGGQILHALGLRQVRLLTNNPAKVASVEAAGVRVVERLPLTVGRNATNDAYLQTKAARSGHLL